MVKVFIDGQFGTTGLKLEGKLKNRSDITLLAIDPARREDEAVKKPIIEAADVIFLCLPDDAARASVKMARPDALVIDASTAHRTAPGWAYGFPELSPRHRENIVKAKRIAVPGCHAAGFISMVYPLVSAGLISPAERLSCTSLTGYTGGGKALIDVYENGRQPGDRFHAPRPYALTLMHKHLPEMKAISGLENAPHFYPVVGDMPQGMLVTVPIWADPRRIHAALAAHYKTAQFVKVLPFGEGLEDGFVDPTACNGTNNLEIMVFGNPGCMGEQRSVSGATSPESGQTLLAARLDNLGKGASGAAVQCMNIALGLKEEL